MSDPLQFASLSECVGNLSPAGTLRRGEKERIMKKLICLSFASAIIATSAMAQVSEPPASRDPHMYDRSTTQTVPGKMAPSSQTGTMSDKSMGPGKTTSTDPGPDGSPGNGSPAKTTGGQQ
jgi:hypothetical protein